MINAMYPLLTRYLAKLPLWLSTFVLFTLIAGCGAGLQLANGIGGTGITMGSITGFGSMYVNGIKFNTDNAVFKRDGLDAKQQSDFSAGEVVKIIGTVDPETATGIASEVIFSDLLEGPVTATLQGKSIEVLGQLVTINELTVLHGFSSLRDLQLDNMLEISGFSDAQGNIIASSIKLLQQFFSIDSILDIEGHVSHLNPESKTFRLNDNLTIDYSTALFEGTTEAELHDTQYLAITSEQNIDNGVIVAQIIYAIDNSVEIGTQYEITGLVTRFVSVTDFDIDGLAVRTTSQTVYKNGTATQLALNKTALIRGTVDTQGIIVADNITLFDSNSEVFIEATIDAIDIEAQQIQLLGETFLIDNFTLYSDDTQTEFVSLDLQQFSLGESVFLVAYRNQQGQNIVTRLSKVAPISTLYLSTNLDATPASVDSLVLFGQTISSSSTTLYLDANSQVISATEFFNALVNNPQQSVDVIGISIGNKAILAEFIGLLE